MGNTRVSSLSGSLISLIVLRNQSRAALSGSLHQLVQKTTRPLVNTHSTSTAGVAHPRFSREGLFLFMLLPIHGLAKICRAKQSFRKRFHGETNAEDRFSGRFFQTRNAFRNLMPLIKIGFSFFLPGVVIMLSPL